MADHSITVSNSLSMFGMGEANRWNSFNWGEFYWGDNPDLAMAATHLIAESVTLDSAITKYVEHLIAESAAITDGISKDITTYVDTDINTLVALAGDATSEFLQDGSGYKYKFPDRVTNAEQRANNTYTSSTARTTTWDEAAEPDDDWSET